METLHDLEKKYSHNIFQMCYGECFDLKKVPAHPVINYENVNKEKTKKLREEKKIVFFDIEKIKSTELATLFQVDNINEPSGIIEFWIAKSNFTFNVEKKLLIIPIWVFNSLQIAPKQQKAITFEMARNSFLNDIAMKGGYESEGFAGLGGEEAHDAYWNCD